jgi:hypothetical protein
MQPGVTKEKAEAYFKGRAVTKLEAYETMTIGRVGISGGGHHYAAVLLAMQEHPDLEKNANLQTVITEVKRACDVVYVVYMVCGVDVAYMGYVKYMVYVVYEVCGVCGVCVCMMRVALPCPALACHTLASRSLM